MDNRQDSQALRYPDYLWRIRQVAQEELLWTVDSYISLPTVCRNQEGRSYAMSFLCSQPDATRQLSAPLARIGLFPSGEVAICERMPDSQRRQLASSTSLSAPGLTPQERRAFAETYGELLALPDGPLLSTWNQVAKERWRDLQVLFHALAEPSLQSDHQQYAAEYLSILQAHVLT